MEKQQCVKPLSQNGVLKTEEQSSGWKTPGDSSEDKQEISSSSSFFSGSNFTMSCSGAETQEENEPSTSGCSSFLAHNEKERHKAKKKERIKEYLKELKSLVQPGKGEARVVGTLSTLQHILTSMRKIKEAKEKTKTSKNILATADCHVEEYGAQSHTVYETDSHESLTCESLKSNDELRIILSSCDHVVRSISFNLKFVLGYPMDSWTGRSLHDYIHKKDLVTFKSFHRTEENSMEVSDEEFTGESKIFYFRLRKFKSLGSSGYSLRKQDFFTPFQCTSVQKKMTGNELKQQSTFPYWFENTSVSSNSGSPEACVSSESSGIEKGNSQEERKWYTIMYCVPLISPYLESRLPELKVFETRQTLYCTFCQIQPNAIPLLGYLPQEMVGVSIFEFFHNDDLERLYNIFQKVIALKGVPYKSTQIRLLAKNGSWISCVTEWSSFVNPWTSKLEFIIGKHTVVKGPDNVDVFSENYEVPRFKETPQSILLARQKIKDLLLQPVETVCLSNTSDKETKKGARKSVAIVEENESMEQEDVISASNHEKLYSGDKEKTALQRTYLLFKENSISRAYDQLNYTNCIKKFLLSQPCSFSSESDVNKSSCASTSEDDMKPTGKSVEKWLRTSFDDIIHTKHLHRASEDSHSLPALNDEFWEKRIILSDMEFDFDIKVPKPPSFGSSTKVLVSEQEHRDNENLDGIGIREQHLQPYLDNSTPLSPPVSLPVTTQDLPTIGCPPIVTLTRETLWKHTVLQEQMYISTASADRNILFLNESREHDYSCKRLQSQTLKRSHSPDRSSTERCKTGRHSSEGMTNLSILNPILPIHNYEGWGQENGAGMKKSSVSTRVIVPMQMYPFMSQSQNQLLRQSQVSQCNAQCTYNEISGMTNKPHVMLGFRQSANTSPRLSNIGDTIPVHKLDSYTAKQTNFLVPNMSPQPSSLKQGRQKNINQMHSSSDSSVEDTSSFVYLLESSGNKIKMAYNSLVIQSLAQQMLPSKGLNPIPWLQQVHFSDSVQLRYHINKTNHKQQLKKDCEFLENVVQPNLVLDQFIELLQDNSEFQDQEQDYLFFTSEENDKVCSCTQNMCCKGSVCDGHGISEALKNIQKQNRKEKRLKKMMHSTKLKHGPFQKYNMNMDVDCDVSELVLPEPEYIIQSKPESCSSKSKSLKSDRSSDSQISIKSNFTVSDQRSHNENGSSLKESDGDAMSKNSDSSMSDKQLVSSESESDYRNLMANNLYIRLFTEMNICFPHRHKEVAPWLANVDFNEDIKLKYHLSERDMEAVLENDRLQLESLYEPEMVQDQLLLLMEELGDSSLEMASVI